MERVKSVQNCDFKNLSMRAVRKSNLFEINDNRYMITIKPLIQGTPNTKLKCFLSNLAVVFAQSIGARC